MNLLSTSILRRCKNKYTLLLYHTYILYIYIYFLLTNGYIIIDCTKEYIYCCSLWKTLKQLNYINILIRVKDLQITIRNIIFLKRTKTTVEKWENLPLSTFVFINRGCKLVFSIVVFGVGVDKVFLTEEFDDKGLSWSVVLMFCFFGIVNTYDIRTLSFLYINRI